MLVFIFYYNITSIIKLSSIYFALIFPLCNSVIDFAIDNPIPDVYKRQMINWFLTEQSVWSVVFVRKMCIRDRYKTGLTEATSSGTTAHYFQHKPVMNRLYKRNNNFVREIYRIHIFNQGALNSFSLVVIFRYIYALNFFCSV